MFRQGPGREPQGYAGLQTLYVHCTNVLYEATCPNFFDGRCASTILRILTSLHQSVITLCSRSRCGAREAMTVGCKPTIIFSRAARAPRLCASYWFTKRNQAMQLAMPSGGQCFWWSLVRRAHPGPPAILNN